jgi:Anti-sigma-K factor rskA
MNEDELSQFLEAGSHPLTRARKGALRPAEEVRDLLGAEIMWVEPDPGGADALLATIRREVALVAGSLDDLDDLPADVGGLPFRPPAWSGAPADAFGPPAEPVPVGAGAGGAGGGGSPGAGPTLPPRLPLAAVPSPALPPSGRQPSRPAHASHAAPSGRRWASVRLPVSVLAAAAALVVLAGAVGMFAITRGEDHPAGTEFAIAGTPLVPDASANATVEDQSAGVSIKLDVRGLPPAKPGTYYQAWVSGSDGAVTIGTFHMRGGDGWIYLWSGVETDRYPTLNVTLENEGIDPASSGLVVLTGRIAT